MTATTRARIRSARNAWLRWAMAGLVATAMHGRACAAENAFCAMNDDRAHAQEAAGHVFDPRERFQFGVDDVTCRPMAAARALVWLRPLASEGYAWAQYYAGKALVDQGDVPGAVRSFRAAAEQGFRSAALELSTLYDEGRGIEKDRKQACTWLAVSREFEPDTYAACRHDLSEADWLDLEAFAKRIQAREHAFKDFPR